VAAVSLVAGSEAAVVAWTAFASPKRLVGELIAAPKRGVPAGDAAALPNTCFAVVVNALPPEFDVIPASKRGLLVLLSGPPILKRAFCAPDGGGPAGVVEAAPNEKPVFVLIGVEAPSFAPKMLGDAAAA